MEADKEKYLTQSAYTRREAGELSPNHEDFIEMICRMGDMPVRIKNLSQWLGVSPSVASRSASALRDLGYCTFEKYGFVTLTDKGRKTGRYLIRRHRAVERLLTLICGEAELAEVEKTEHYLSEATVEKIERFLDGREA